MLLKNIAVLILFLLVGEAKLLGQNFWISVTKPTTLNLYKLFFIDTSTGWVAGDSGFVAKTTNAGQTWTRQNTAVTQSIVDIFMLNAQTGWALANVIDSNFNYWTVILSTTDAGSY